MASTNVPQYRPVSGVGAIKLRDRAEELKYKQEAEGLKAKRKADIEKDKASADYVGKLLPAGVDVLPQDSQAYQGRRQGLLSGIQEVIVGPYGDIASRVLSNRPIGRPLTDEEKQAVGKFSQNLEALGNLNRTAKRRLADRDKIQEMRAKGDGIFITPKLQSLLDTSVSLNPFNLDGTDIDPSDLLSNIAAGRDSNKITEPFQELVKGRYLPEVEERGDTSGIGNNALSTKFTYVKKPDIESIREDARVFAKNAFSVPNNRRSLELAFGGEEGYAKYLETLAPPEVRSTKRENSSQSASGAAEQKSLSGVSLAATPQSDSRGKRLSEGLTRALPKTIAIGRSAGIPGSDDDTTLEGARSYNRIAGSESGRIFTNEEFKALIDQNLAEGKHPLFGFNSIVAARGTVGKNISVPAAGWNTLTPEQRTEIVINDPTKLAEWNRRFPGVPLSPENARAKESLEGVTAILQALTPPRPDQPIKIVSTDIVDTQFSDANEAQALGLPLPNTSFINLQDLATKYPAALKKMYSGGDGTPSETLRIIEDALARYKQSPRTGTPASAPASAAPAKKKVPGFSD